MTQVDARVPGIEKTPLEAALGRLRLLHPRARFFQAAPVAAGKLDAEPSEQSFQYVSLFEHRIGNSIRSVGGHVFIIANGFLPSHAYNIALAWLWCASRAPGEHHRWDALLRHNYKKFFAECVLARQNRLIGRALLVETIAYEQGLMRPLFADAKLDPELRQSATDIASLMSSLVSMHELAHYMLRRDRAAVHTQIGGLLDGAAGEAFRRIDALHGDAFAEEVLCDAFAAHQAVLSEESTLRRHDLTTRARMAAFGFQVFSDLIGLELSAQHTASQPDDDTVVDLASANRSTVSPPLFIGRSAGADLRAHEITTSLQRLVASRGGDMFEIDGAFPLPETTWPQLRAAFAAFHEPIEPLDAGMTGTDDTRRGLARLLAESLHEHPRGAEFLLWRSKIFSVGGEDVDP